MLGGGDDYCINRPDRGVGCILISGFLDLLESQTLFAGNLPHGTASRQAPSSGPLEPPSPPRPGRKCLLLLLLLFPQPFRVSPNPGCGSRLPFCCPPQLINGMGIRARTPPFREMLLRHGIKTMGKRANTIAQKSVGKAMGLQENLVSAAPKQTCCVRPGG